ncbi:MAG TPA: hypothetical protein VKA46_15815, partial [Gemmataceae bacterium]|nr:hypothetical protein [Gemmataceae bacterium]
ELARASPDRAEVGKALERVLFYAARSRNFPGWTAAILDPLRAVVAWLGEDWQRLNPETPAGIR